MRVSGIRVTSVIMLVRGNSTLQRIRMPHTAASVWLAKVVQPPSLQRKAWICTERGPTRAGNTFVISAAIRQIGCSTCGSTSNVNTRTCNAKIVIFLHKTLTSSGMTWIQSMLNLTLLTNVYKQKILKAKFFLTFRMVRSGSTFVWRIRPILHRISAYPKDG